MLACATMPCRVPCASSACCSLGMVLLVCETVVQEQKTCQAFRITSQNTARVMSKLLAAEGSASDQQEQHSSGARSPLVMQH